MSIDTIFLIYLWFLTIVSFLCGITMTIELVRNKHKKGNYKKNEVVLHYIQRFFWIFLGFMAVIGLVLGMLAF